MTQPTIRPSGGAQLAPPSAETATTHDAPLPDVLHLAELVPVVRERLTLDNALPDAAILASLEAIMRRSNPRARWRAAFDSSIGRWLALRGADLSTSISQLLTLLPKPLS